MSWRAFDLSARSVCGHRDRAVIERPRRSQDDYVLWDGVLPLRTTPASPRSSFSLWKGSNQPEKLSTIDSNLMKLNHTCPPSHSAWHLCDVNSCTRCFTNNQIWHYCMEHRVNRSTIFDFDPFYIFSPGKTITLLVFPFLHDGGLFPWRYNPIWDGRTGLVRTERQPQLYQTRQLMAEQRHQTSLTGCMEANPRWRRKKARVQSPPHQSINQSNTLLIPDGAIHGKQGQQHIKQLTHRQHTDGANLHWRPLD